jgi:hypothetical protein
MTILQEDLVIRIGLLLLATLVKFYLKMARRLSELTIAIWTA